VNAPAATTTGFSPARIGAVALAVALTTFVLHAIRCTHPPAGASAIIVALGILQTPEQLLVMFGAVVLVTALAWAFNRSSGVIVHLLVTAHRAPSWQAGGIVNRRLDPPAAIASGDDVVAPVLGSRPW